MENFITILIAKILNFILRLLGKNGGNVTGKIIKKLKYNILESLKIESKVIIVTGTNGKTSTNNCIYNLLKNNKKKVLCNKAGNNMETGIISMLLKFCTLTGKIREEYITLEVDENYVPIICKKIKVDTIIVLNFFPDQIERNGNVKKLSSKFEAFLKEYKGNLILNGDDPNVVKLGYVNKFNKNNTYYFGLDRYQYSIENSENNNSEFCPNDNEKLNYEYYQYSHIGKFKCPICGFGNEEKFTYIYNINLNTGFFEENGIQYNSRVSNIYTLYNYAAILTLSKLYNLDSIKTFETFEYKNGRNEKQIIKECETILNLAKNKDGMNINLKELEYDETEKELMIAVNDKIADGEDVSWIWDINFKFNNVKKIITSGTRAYDLAICIKTNLKEEILILPYQNIQEAVYELYKNKNKKYIIGNYTTINTIKNELKKL